jgi:hypothetical protein
LLPKRFRETLSRRSKTRYHAALKCRSATTADEPAVGDGRCGRDVAMAEALVGHRFPLFRRDWSRSPLVVARLRPWRVEAR